MTDAATFICDICHENYHADTSKKLCAILCGHVYHINCLDTWFHTQRHQNNITTCPNCRRPVIGRQVIRLYLFGSGSSSANLDVSQPNAENFFFLSSIEDRPDLKTNLELIWTFSSSILRFWSGFEWLRVLVTPISLLAEMVFYMIWTVLLMLPYVLFMVAVILLKIIFALLLKLQSMNDDDMSE